MIVRSTLPELTLPDSDFSTLVLERARRVPKKVALIDADGGETIIYGQLTEAIDAMAGGLIAHGLRQGDVVAVRGSNSPAFVVVHAIWRAGGIVAPMNPLLTVRETEQELTDADARYLVAGPEAIEQAVEAAGLARLQAIPAVCATCEAEPGQPRQSPGAPSLVRTMFSVGEGEVGLGMTSLVSLASGQHRPPR